MAERLSPLASFVDARLQEDIEQDREELCLREIAPIELLQVGCWADNAAKIERALAKIAGTETPPGLGQFVRGDRAWMLHFHPLCWWLLHPSADAQKAVGQLPPDEAPSLDLSHSRAAIEIRGLKAEMLLSCLLPLDLSEDTSGSVFCCAIHGAPAHLISLEDAYNLLLPRSYALSLAELINQSARQFKGAWVATAKKEVDSD